MVVANAPENLRAIESGRILGIDFGSKRIGLAMSDPFQLVASTLKTLVSKNMSEVAQNILEITRQYQIKAVVIGQPLHMSGDKGDMADKVHQFAQILDKVISIPIFYWDERWTTKSAEKLLIETGKSPSKNRKKIDQLAAAFMLQGFLDRISYLKRPV